MEVLKLRPGMELRTPADPLALVIGVVAHGRAVIVMQTRSDESLEELREKARRVAGCQRISKQVTKKRLDKGRRRAQDAH